MSAIVTIAGYALREALRRKVFAVVLLLTAGFLFLYWLANHYLFRDVNNLGSPSPAIEPRTFAGAFMVGLAMFSTLFLGVVLAIFLTLGAVRGDAERGLLQPLLVRPVSRPTLLLARWLGAIAVSDAVRDRGLRNRRRDHRPHRRLVAGPRRGAGDRARRRRRDRGGALAARIGLPHRDRERDRDLHALRGRPRLRAARLDRPRAQLAPPRALGDDHRVGCAVRGALPGRAARRSPPTRSA